MTKLATLALVLLVTSLGHVRAQSLDGKPVPLFPELGWGLSEQAALSKGLERYTRGPKANVIGLPSVKRGGIDFSAQALFGKQDVRAVPSGLDTLLLQHEGTVPTKQYYAFLRSITKGFIYAGRGSGLDESSVFYDAVDGASHLVVTSSDHAKVSLGVEIAPGRSK